MYESENWIHSGCEYCGMQCDDEKINSVNKRKDQIGRCCFNSRKRQQNAGRKKTWISYVCANAASMPTSGNMVIIRARTQPQLDKQDSFAHPGRGDEGFVEWQRWNHRLYTDAELGCVAVWIRSRYQDLCALRAFVQEMGQLCHAKS